MLQDANASCKSSSILLASNLFRRPSPPLLAAEGFTNGLAMTGEGPIGAGILERVPCLV